MASNKLTQIEQLIINMHEFVLIGISCTVETKKHCSHQSFTGNVLQTKYIPIQQTTRPDARPERCRASARVLLCRLSGWVIL